MKIGKTAGRVSVVSDSEVLVIFFILGGEGTARNISELHKIM